MNKLDMQTKDIIDSNIEKIKELFPSTVSENGIDFKEAVVLETQKAEFSYPCLYVLNNSLYISYTSKRTNIRIHKYNFV